MIGTRPTTMQLTFDFLEEVSTRPPPALHLKAVAPEPPPTEPLDLLSYDVYIVMFSGGKDSAALYLALREAGVPNEKIELWHHDIDGREGSRLMDWRCTRAYCRAFARTFNAPIYFSWREGGFEREMLREEQATAAVRFEKPDGCLGRAGGESDNRSTRRRFPQMAASLKTRWCSSSLKIDVASSAICNQERLQGRRVLVLTGERAEESTARACYAFFEPHRTDRRRSKKLARYVDQLRLVQAWSEQQVWDILRRWRINPHPCYRLGWGRCSCAACIFGSNDQWASLRVVNPEQFGQVAGYEGEFGCTIRRDRTTAVQAADQGKPYPSITPELIAEAMNEEWNGPVILPIGEEWVLPAGAFGDSAGPI